jgi:hypothetical protein
MSVVSGEDHCAACAVLPSVRVSLPGCAQARVGTEVEVEVESGKWKVESGKWKVESGKWKVESGKWKVESGKWKVESSGSNFEA